MACSGFLQQPGTFYLPQQTLAHHQHRYGLARHMAVAVGRLEVEAYLTPPKPCHMGIDQGFR